MEYKVVDKRFIDYWEKKYDQIENDEPEYLEIIDLVSSSIKSVGYIKQEVFKRIIDWKDPRIKGIINFNKYEDEYIRAIKMCIEEKLINNKIELLINLKGIGVPTASTIIHFMEPESYPIIDIRTTESLNHFGYDIHSSKKVKDYLHYYNIINSIRNKTKKSLRKIDRALFSYHKINKLGKKNVQCENNFNRIEQIIQRHYNMSADNLLNILAAKYIVDSNQLETFKSQGVWQKVKFNYLAGHILTQRNRYVFSPLDIREVVCELIPELTELNDNELSGSVLTQDVHLKAKTEYNNGFPCLDKVERGKYKFFGFII